ncbi:hypothetical protein L9F63_020994, partial [Diploptera punctata]
LDTDLVFDDVRHHHSTPQHSRKVAPVEIPEEDVPEPESSFFNSISEIGRRAKRDLLALFAEPETSTSANIFDAFNFWGGGQATTSRPDKEKRSTDAVEEEEAQDLDEEDTESTTDHTEATAAAAHRHEPISAPVEEDDEDYINEPSSGSGTPPPKAPAPPTEGQPRFYRTTFTHYSRNTVSNCYSYT